MMHRGFAGIQTSKNSSGIHGIEESWDRSVKWSLFRRGNRGGKDTARKGADKQRGRKHLERDPARKRCLTQTERLMSKEGGSNT